MVKPKSEGGLGFREARINNKAMLSKIVWKTARNERTIWMDLINTKYLKGQSILHYVAKPANSPCWKGVVKYAQDLNSSFRWRIGDSAQIRFFLDTWFNGKGLYTVIPRIDRRDMDVRLNQLLSSDGRWNFDSLHTEIPQGLVEELMEADFRIGTEPDLLIWNETASGLFSCQSAYCTLKRQDTMTEQRRSSNINWKLLWKSKLPNKFKHFLWLAMQDRLMTNMLCFKRQMTHDASCTICSGVNETTAHILRDCKAAKLIWKEVLTPQDLIKFEDIQEEGWFKGNFHAKFATKLNTAASWPTVFLARFGTFGKQETRVSSEASQ